MYSFTLQVTGYGDSVAVVEIEEHDDGKIIARGHNDKMSSNTFERAVARYYPDRVFYRYLRGPHWCAEARAGERKENDE